MKQKIVIMMLTLLGISASAGYLYAANGDLIVNGNLGVGIQAPDQKISSAGTIESTIGGFKFPDGSTQTSAWLPAGTIIMFGGLTAPAGWLLADGSTVSRTTYAGLFAAIGTTFGVGDGSSTFNLPDFRGVFPKGAGTTTRAAGIDALGNRYTATLGAYTQDRIQGHWHALYSYSNLGEWSYGNQGRTIYNHTGNNTPGRNDIIRSPIADGTNGTPRIGNTTEPQSVGVNFIIKY